MKTYVKRMYPAHPEVNFLYGKDEESFLEEMYGLMDEVTQLQREFNQFTIKASPLFSLEQMATSPLEVQLLQGFIAAGKCRRILEIGTFVGFSTLHFLSAAGEGAQVTTIEKFDQFANIAQENFMKNNAAGRIELLRGDAKELLPRLQQQGRTFDFIYLDGDKENYDTYFLLLDALLEKGGLLVADDVFFSGDTFNKPPTTEKAKGIIRFLQAASTATAYRKTFIPLFSGVLVLVKK